MPPSQPLPRDFYQRPTLDVARELLGKIIVRQTNGETLIGKIVETEAYIGQDDPACHAAKGRTPRTELMFGEPGYAYIYFIYGMYYCLNAVTEQPEFPAAVLIRAVEPLEGLQTMRSNRNRRTMADLTNGPGKLCQAMMIGKHQNGIDLCQSGELYIAAAPAVPTADILATRRIGIRVGTEKAWRFCLSGNRFVSHPRHR